MRSVRSHLSVRVGQLGSELDRCFSCEMSALEQTIVNIYFLRHLKLTFLHFWYIRLVQLLMFKIGYYNLYITRPA